MYSIYSVSYSLLGLLIIISSMYTTCMMYTYLCLPAYTTIEPSEGHYLFFLRDISEISYCLPQVHSLDGLGRLTSVLEVHPQFHSAGFTCWINTGWLVHHVHTQGLCTPCFLDLHFAAFSGSVEYLPMVCPT